MFLTMEMQNSHQNRALRMGSQGWHKFPKQPASREACGNTLGQSKEEGGITDNEQTSPTQGVLTLKRKSFFL